MYPVRQIVLFGCVFACGLCLANCAVEKELINPDHCWNAEGNATCQALSPMTPYCSMGADPCEYAYLGCVAAVPEPTCYSPCGNQETAEQNSSCLAVADGDESSDSMGSTDPDTETGDGEPECEDHGDCQGALGFCQAGRCVECMADDDCPGLCDADHNTCVPCIAQDECPGQAGCNLGECLPPDRVWYVGPDEDLSNIGMAVAALQDAGDVGTIIVHPNNDGYFETITVPPGHTIAIRGAEGEDPPELLNAFNAECTMASNYGLHVQGQLFLDRFVLRGRGGIRTDAGGEAHVTRTRITASGCRVVFCDGGSIHTTNSMLTSDAIFSPFRLTGKCGVEVRATTISSGWEPPFECLNAGVASGSFVDKSLLHSSIESPSGCADTELEVSTNVVTTQDPSWFEAVPEGDLHLTDDAPLATLAAGTVDVEAGDPEYDIDGDYRDPDYVGADVPD